MRVLGTWLGLAYVYASAAGAAGVGGCIHADTGDGEGHSHGTHAAATVFSKSDHQPTVSVPCASGEDQAQGAEKALSHHGASDPCDCLGNCSIGTGMADLSAARTLCAATRTASGTSLPNPDQVQTTADQHRLPYPNAPPLL